MSFFYRLFKGGTYKWIILNYYYKCNKKNNLTFQYIKQNCLKKYHIKFCPTTYIYIIYTICLKSKILKMQRIYLFGLNIDAVLNFILASEKRNNKNKNTHTNSWSHSSIDKRLTFSDKTHIQTSHLRILWNCRHL